MKPITQNPLKIPKAFNLTQTDETKNMKSKTLYQKSEIRLNYPTWNGSKVP